LKHDGEGVVCMANAGPNTNKQQFYITLSNNKTKSQHLDRKHSVFGKVVKEGMQELTTALQKVKTDSKDRPVIKTFDTNNNSGEKTKTNIVIVIVATEVLEDPAWEAQEQVEQRLTKLHEEREATTKKRNEQTRKRKCVGTTTIDAVATATGVGKYLSRKAFQNNNNSDNNNTSRKEEEEEEVDTLETSGSSSTATTTTTTAAIATLLPSFGLPRIASTVGTKIGRIDSVAKKTKAKFGDFSSW